MAPELASLNQECPLFRLWVMGHWGAVPWWQKGPLTTKLSTLPRRRSCLAPLLMTLLQHESTRPEMGCGWCGVRKRCHDTRLNYYAMQDVTLIDWSYHGYNASDLINLIPCCQIFWVYLFQLRFDFWCNVFGLTVAEQALFPSL